MQAWVFPGQGSQRRGMGQELFPLFENYLAIADRVLGYSVKELCLENPSQRLNQTKFTQPAIFVVNALSAMHAERHHSRPPEFHAGFSLGEYNALLAAGAFDFETGLRLVEKRASLMDAVDGGSMAAVIGLDASELEDFIESSGMRSVSIANFNTHDQLVISGPGLCENAVLVDGQVSEPLQRTRVHRSAHARIAEISAPTPTIWIIRFML